MKKINTIIVLSLIYMEVLFHVFAFYDFYVLMPIISILFIGFLTSIICSLFNKYINRALYITSIVIFTFLYLLQFLYYKILGFVCSMKSLSMAGQAATAYENIINSMIDNWYVIILFLAPLIVSIILIKKVEFIKNNKELLQNIGLTILSFCLLIISLNYDKTSIYSNYNLYHNLGQPLLITKNLGVLTEVRLDIKRSIFGLNEHVLVKETLNKEYDSSKYNILDIDFVDTNKSIKELNNYFKNTEPTLKNNYTNLFKDKNVIYILAESLDPIAIDEKLTPTLYKMTNSGFKFTNYYTPLFPKSTSDGEYMSDWGIVAKIDNESNLIDSMNNDNPFMLVNQFNLMGYNTYAYHNYYGEIYSRRDYFKNLGFKKYAFCEDGIVKSCKMGDYFKASDFEMFQNTSLDYINDEHFYVHYVTLSGHGAYRYETNFVAQKYWDYVKDFDYPEELKVYLAANMDLDKGLEYLINALEEKGKLDDTVFVITGDHYPYYLNPVGIEVMNLRSDEDRTNKYQLHHNALIIWNNEIKKTEVTNYMSNLDIVPTMLNLLGINYDSRLLLGRDVFSNNDGLVMFSDYSWINKYGSYNSFKNKFTCHNECEVDQEYIDSINTKVRNAFVVSSLVQKNNYYKFALK